MTNKSIMMKTDRRDEQYLRDQIRTSHPTELTELQSVSGRCVSLAQGARSHVLIK